MKKLLENLRVRIRQDLNEELFFNPLDPSDLAVFEVDFFNALSSKIYPEYLEFLKISDGIMWEGVFLYSAIARDIPDSQGSKSPELIELNEIYRDVSWMKRYVVYGEGDMEMFVHNLSNGKFQVVDKIDDTLAYEEFDTMGGMINYALSMMLERTV